MIEKKKNIRTHFSFRIESSSHLHILQFGLYVIDNYCFFTFLLYGFSYTYGGHDTDVCLKTDQPSFASNYLHYQDLQYFSVVAFVNNFPPLGLSSS